MYCPHCAAQNIDGAKFCRACGSDLEIVSLALNDPSALRAKSKDKTKKPLNRLEKRIEGVNNTIQGACMLVASLLIGLALALFVPAEVPWILVWMVFFGWLAVWGAFAVAEGVAALAESRMRLGQAEPVADEIDAANTSELLPAAREVPTISNASTSEISPQKMSVTEHTTELLSNRQPRVD